MAKMTLRKRRYRIRQRLKFMTKRPRLSVHKTNKYVYAQLIDMRTGDVLASYDTKRLVKDNPKAAELSGMERALEVGRILGKDILKKGIKQIVFDRSGYKYHGYVKAIAEGLREVGLDF